MVSVVASPSATIGKQTNTVAVVIPRLWWTNIASEDHPPTQHESLVGNNQPYLFVRKSIGKKVTFYVLLVTDLFWQMGTS